MNVTVNSTGYISISIHRNTNYILNRMSPYFRYCNECGKKIDVTKEIHFDDGERIECFPRHSLQKDQQFMRAFNKIGN